MEDDFDEDGPEIVKKFMYVNRKAPFGTVYALEMLEKVLIAAAFEQDVHLVFMDDGVFQLKKDIDTSGINMKNFTPTFRALEGFEVEKVYVEKESLEARGLTEDDLLIEVELLTKKELSALMETQEVLMTA